MVKEFLRSLAPACLDPSAYLTRLVRFETGMRVCDGPFQGMLYVDASVGSAYLPKLLGIYERELNRCIEQACNLNFPLIVDIGAAEGYYAVGMARRNPGARLVAFESEIAGRAAVEKMAHRNGVRDRIEILGTCGWEDLASVLSCAEHPLVICDVEGQEEVLMDPVRVAGLVRAHVLVELHEFVHRGITERMRQRFQRTHHIEHIWQEPRRRSDFPYRSFVTRFMRGKYFDWAVSEWRPERMAWLWLQPKARPDE